MEKIINDTIKANNRELDKNLAKFLKEQNNHPAKFSALVPTCIILTSSESASSVETQFSTLSDSLADNVKSKLIVLDGKKCGNTKSAIEHFFYKL